MTSTDVSELIKSPISWKRARNDSTVGRVLRSMQPNIVKGHGRDHTRNLFWNFEGADRAELRSVVRSIGRRMPSALDQLEATEVFKQTGQSGAPVICFMLRPGGYEALGANSAIPQDEAFLAGMQVRGPGLSQDPRIGDPELSAWEESYRERIDALLLVATDDLEEIAMVAEMWISRLSAAGARLIRDEPGTAIKRRVADVLEGVEHFGYVDGRSQPLFLAEDVEREPRSIWNPAFPPSQFLVKDPGDEDETSFGSYFVFRKLEQNVKGFKDHEKKLAEALGLAGGPFEERAGALVVGRFEDGTPVVLDPLATDMTPINDFDFRGDEDGRRCPFVAHIRKTNPRGESPLHLANDLGVRTTARDERRHIMARRGITYGKRQYDPGSNDFTDSPEDNVGLLFMAYMANIAEQFEFTQAAWANNPDFVTGGVGIDAVIGQGPAAPIPVPDGWSGAAPVDFDFGRFVTMKGGEYFFAPSKDFLKNV